MKRQHIVSVGFYRQDRVPGMYIPHSSEIPFRLMAIIYRRADEASDIRLLGRRQ